MSKAHDSTDVGFVDNPPPDMTIAAGVVGDTSQADSPKRKAADPSSGDESAIVKRRKAMVTKTSKRLVLMEHAQIVPYLPESVFVPSCPADHDRIFKEYSTYTSSSARTQSPSCSSNADLDYLLGLWNDESGTLPLTQSYQMILQPSAKSQAQNDVNSTQAESGSSKTVRRHRNLADDLAPVSRIEDIFDLMAAKATQHGFVDACGIFAEQSLRVVTMCSGTEAPILALNLLEQAYERQSLHPFKVEHLASAEIEPSKQAYIERNFHPPVIFRDVTEFLDEKKDPHTAYGGTAKRPEDVHVLIAGSSCVDYSKMNNKPQKFGAQGESYSTLRGIRAYAKQCRPQIVIIENVKGAPWDQIRRFWHEAGYFCQVVFVDSKDFYIPQTRQRGYMVGFDEVRAKEIDFGLVGAATKFVRLMGAFSQRASAPYTDFIFSDDDAELQEYRYAQATVNRGSKDKSLDWASCRHRHNGARNSGELGSQRPLTRWKNNGSCTPVDFVWQSWMRNQRERILDMIDINFLDHIARRDYDLTGKSRVLDLSQNIDRDCDNRPWGIIGCITPSGIPYDTLRGGPLMGKEALALQGIPVSDLYLAQESSKQMQDLAGNAMTTTVIGAVIFSAVIAGTIFAVDPGGRASGRYESSIFRSYRPQNDRCPSEQESESRSMNKLLTGSSRISPESSGSSNFEQTHRSLGSVHSIPVAELVAMASASVQLCRCEGTGKSAQVANFQICTDCNHTTCTKCGGNPIHNFESFSEAQMNLRSSPSDFITEVTAALPRLLRLSSDESTSVINGFQPAGMKSLDVLCYRDSVKKAIKETFLFHKVTRSFGWRVAFDADNARLELQFGPGSQSEPLLGVAASPKSQLSCSWFLFAKPPRSEAMSSPVRTILKYPVCRMTPDQSLLSGTWEIRIPASEDIDLLLSGNGEPVRAWEAKLGLQGPMFKNRMVYPQLLVQQCTSISEGNSPILSRISGMYELLQDCGTASGSLHRRVKPAAAEPMFLFLDPGHLNEALSDSFVFANNCSRLPSSSVRHVIAKLEPGWRPTATNLEQSVKCAVYDQWMKCSTLMFDVASSAREITVWSPGDLILFLDDQSADCSNDAAILVARLPLTREQRILWRDGKSYSIPVIGASSALQQLHWALKVACDRDDFGRWQTIELNKPNGERCLGCAPAAPILEWKWTRKQHGEQAVVRPFENREEAAKYEAALKLRPVPVTTFIHSEGASALVEIRLNLTTLHHRVSAKVENGRQVSLWWRIAADDGLEPSPIFEQLQLTNTANFAGWLSTSHINSGISQDRPRMVSRELWAEQLRTLAWMRDQELGSISWAQWEQEEVCMPALGWRLDVRAMSQSEVRGGILADEVGAGKTATSLALIATDFQHCNTLPAPVYGKNQGTLPLKATLILVPSNIVKQWGEEISKCLEAGLNIVTIPSMDELKIQTVTGLQEADIILTTWDIFEEDDYWDCLRQLCLAPTVPRLSGRGFEQWLAEALHDLALLVDAADGCIGSDLFWQKRTELQYQAKTKYRKYQAFGNRKTMAKKQKQAKATAETPIPAPVNTSRTMFEVQESYPNPAQETDIDDDDDGREGIDDDLNKSRLRLDGKKKTHLIFHLFRFHRVVVDEFTYLTGHSLLALLRLASPRRWMLSGTPPLIDYDSVNTMAKLLGSKITCEDEMDGHFGFGLSRNKTAKDKTYAEVFQSLVSSHSPAWLRARNSRAQDFADGFIRQNPARQTTTAVFHHYHLVRMSPTEVAIYLEIFQQLTSQSFQFGKAVPKKANAEQSRQDRIAAAIEGSESAEAALLCCSVNLLAVYVKNMADSSDICIFDQLISEKQDEFVLSCKDIMTELQETFDYAYTQKIAGETERNNPHFATFLAHVSRDAYGDWPTTQFLARFLYHADQNRIPAREMKCKASKVVRGSVQAPLDDSSPLAEDDDEEDDDLLEVEGGRAAPGSTVGGKVVAIALAPRQQELSKRATLLNTLTMKLVEVGRSLRLLRAIRSVIADEALPACSGCGQATGTDSDAYILGLCGHVACRACIHDSPQRRASPDTCVDAGCGSAALNHHLVRASSFALSQTSRASLMGSKMDAVVEAISRIDLGDYILVFVQFDSIRDQLIAAFTANQVSYMDGTRRSKSSIKGFKEAAEQSVAGVRHTRRVSMSKHEQFHRRVLILKIDSADGAGWNLQVANHVMFVTPLVAPTQYEYTAIMTQAIGRARRYGQRKPVHVYHFTTANTIEVNILQERINKKLVQHDGRYELVAHDEAAATEAEADFSGMSLDQAASG